MPTRIPLRRYLASFTGTGEGLAKPPVLEMRQCHPHPPKLREARTDGSIRLVRFSDLGAAKVPATTAGVGPILVLASVTPGAGVQFCLGAPGGPRLCVLWGPGVGRMSRGRVQQSPVQSNPRHHSSQDAIGIRELTPMIALLAALRDTTTKAASG